MQRTIDELRETVNESVGLAGYLRVELLGFCNSLELDIEEYESLIADMYKRIEQFDTHFAPEFKARAEKLGVEI